MKVFRRLLFWLHLIAGISAVIVVVIMSATGVALTYQRQMQAWADRGDWRPPVGQPARLSPDALLAKARAENPAATVTSITLRAGDHELASITKSVSGAPATTLQIDPYTGAVVPPGRWAAGMRATFRWMTDWHRWLGRAGDQRATGRAITGAANLVFLFLVLSGLYLWWPVQLSRRAFAAVTTFRLGLRPRARDFNWHNVIGFWSAIPLAIVVASGSVISYPWASNLVYRIAGEAPPAPAPARASATPRPVGGNPAPAEATTTPVGGTSAALTAVVSAASATVTNWRTLAIRLPATPTAPTVVTIDRGTGGQPQYRDTLTLDSQTARVVKWEPFTAQTTGRRWRSYLRFAHTGEVLGLTGQTIAGLVSAGALVLAWTGIALALRRLAAWVRRTVTARQGDEKKAA